MKKGDIIQLVKKLVKEDAYGSATLTTQGPPRTGAIAPADEYPFSRRPKRTGTGMMEVGPPNNPYFNALVIKAKEMGIHVNDLMKSLLKDKSEEEIMQMGYQDLAALAGVEDLSESQGTLASYMLDYADHVHMELVDTMKGVSTYPDKRTGGFYIRFPHYNGPNYTGALFGKDVSDKIDASKAAAKAAALKTVKGFKTEIEDYSITDKSRAGVYGSIHLWIMPKTMDESPMFKTDVKQDMAPKEMAGRIKSVFDKINGAQHPVQTPEWHKNRFKNKYGISFPENIKNINKDQALAMNKYANDMKIKETSDLYTVTTTDGEEKQISFPDSSTAMQTAAKNANVKQVVKLEHHDDEDFPGMSPQQSAYLDRLKETDPAAYKAVEDYIKAMNEIKYAEPDMDDEDKEQDMADVKADMASMMREYIKERGDSNLMEHMDKHRKRSTLMEGATEKLFKLFNAGKTDEEVRTHYLQMNVDMPESFVAKLRNNWESLRKTKLDLKLADQEAAGFKSIATAPVTGMEGGDEGMEETKDKTLATSLFTGQGDTSRS